MSTGRADTEAPILWPPDAVNLLEKTLISVIADISDGWDGKDDAGKD